MGCCAARFPHARVCFRKIGFAAAGIACMKKAEWMSAKGALVLCALCSFVLYLFAPDRGWEGSLIKMRFAWVVVIFSGVVSCTAVRLRRVMPILSLGVAVFVAANLEGRSIGRSNSIVRSASIR